jgi:plastocyanin
MLSGSGFAFSPSTLTVSAGTTIVWKNTTSTPHTVTSNDGKTFDSGNSTPINAGDTFSFKFTKVGTFNYHCSFHPSMIGTIVVK